LWHAAFAENEWNATTYSVTLTSIAFKSFDMYQSTVDRTNITILFKGRVICVCYQNWNDKIFYIVIQFILYLSQCIKIKDKIKYGKELEEIKL